MTKGGSVTTLREARPEELRELQAKRRQFFNLMLVVLALVSGGVALFSLASEQLLQHSLDILDLDVMRVSFVVLALVFALYAQQRERRLAKAESALIESEVRSAALTNRLRELSALAQAGKAVSSVLSLEDVLQLILESARDLLGATEGSVMLFSDDKRRLTISASVGIEEGVAKSTVVEVGEGIAGWVAQFREPVIIQDDVTDHRFHRFVPKSRRVRSAMSAPLFARSEPVGVLNVSISEGGRRYNEHDLQSLSVFAEHAAVAIANARLYEREKEAREHLAEIDQQRRDFVATLTHDLKAPLTSILGYSKMLKGGNGRFSDAEAGEFIDVIDRQGRRILDMVERLVVATRLEEGEPPLARRRLDLREIIDDQVAVLGGVMGTREVEVQVPEGLPPVYGDPSAVQHIVANLLDNAIKYSPDGTRIEVRVEVEASEVRVSVVDEGSGIPPKMLPHVFDRYRRVGGDGDEGHASVGLGLFIVRSLCQAQGGRAWAENEPGRGAKISFSLPYRQEQGQHPAAPAARETAAAP